MVRARAHLRVFEDLETLSAAAARAVVEAANEAIRRRGRFTLALSGGETPNVLYRRLAADHRHDVLWAAAHLFWSDERFVPPDDPRSNSGTARTILAPLLSLLPENVHAPDTEGSNADDAAREYEKELSGFD